MQFAGAVLERCARGTSSACGPGDIEEAAQLSESDSNQPPRDKQLSAELVSLIHHVELHRSGWWDRALDRLVLVAIWLQEPTTLDALCRFLAEGMDHRVPTDRIEEIVQREIATGTIIPMGDRLCVSEEYGTSLRLELEATEVVRAELQGRLATICSSMDIEMEPENLWTDFETLFMEPLVREFGARLYELVKSGAAPDLDHPEYADSTEGIIAKYGSKVRPALFAFLDPHNPTVRDYILRRLNVGFFRHAIALDSRVIDQLSQSMESLKRLFGSEWGVGHPWREAGALPI
jgi:hypothetical protein